MTPYFRQWLASGPVPGEEVLLVTQLRATPHTLAGGETRTSNSGVYASGDLHELRVAHGPQQLPTWDVSGNRRTRLDNYIYARSIQKLKLDDPQFAPPLFLWNLFMLTPQALWVGLLLHAFV